MVDLGLPKEPKAEVVLAIDARMRRDVVFMVVGIVVMIVRKVLCSFGGVGALILLCFV